MSSGALAPVAVLRTPFGGKFGVPRQAGLVPVAEGRVEFLPAYAAPEFTRGLEAFSHLWLVTGFHLNPPWSGSAVVRPPRLGGNARVGVFASRSPNRPNGLGLSLVRLLGLEPGALRVGGVDAADGTPIYDVKPYLPWAEAVEDARADWAEGAPPRREAAEIDLPAELAERLGGERTALVRELLRLEVRPAYQAAAERTYGMTVAGWNVRWRTTDAGGLAVFEAEPARAD